MSDDATLTRQARAVRRAGWQAREARSACVPFRAGRGASNGV